MAINSKTDICNLALDLLSGGVVQNIDIPDDATEAMLERWYDQTKRKLLREHPWNFAVKRAVLAASSTDPAFGYTQQFPLPADFIRLLTIENDEGQMISTESYEMEGGAILVSTDSASLRIRYIYDIGDVVRFDPMFIDLLAHEIALVVAYKMTESNGNVERIEMLRKQRAAIARAIDGQERPPTRREVSRNRDARRQGRLSNSHRIIF